jgi:hypothetical protein
MNAKTEKCLPVELERARVELTAWRERRGPGEHRIPEEVWRQAALAVRRCGLNPVRGIRVERRWRRSMTRPRAPVNGGVRPKKYVFDHRAK